MLKTMIASASLALVVGSGLAGGVDPEKAYPLLQRDLEIAMAREAGLAPWNQEASVYVLERSGYVQVVEGRNDFTCLVGRDYPGTAWPICFDPVGTEAVLPRLLREVELRMQGRSEEEVRSDTAQGFLKGIYRAPDRPGIAYMLSPRAVTSNGLRHFLTPPHLMIYAPNVRASEIGAVRDPHSAMVLFEGDPHAYIIVFVRDDMPDLKTVDADYSLKNFGRGQAPSHDH